MTERTPPKLGEKVFVWPAQRTVRDDARQPVKNEDGTVKKMPAIVRGSDGFRITDRQFVTVDLYTLKQIRGGNLEFCSREEQRSYLQEQQQQLSQKSVPPMSNADRAVRNKKQTTAVADDATANTAT